MRFEVRDGLRDDGGQLRAISLRDRIGQRPSEHQRRRAIVRATTLALGDRHRLVLGVADGLDPLRVPLLGVGLENVRLVLLLALVVETHLERALDRLALLLFVVLLDRLDEVVRQQRQHKEWFGVLGD